MLKCWSFQNFQLGSNHEAKIQDSFRYKWSVIKI